MSALVLTTFVSLKLTTWFEIPSFQSIPLLCVQFGEQRMRKGLRGKNIILYLKVLNLNGRVAYRETFSAKFCFLREHLFRVTLWREKGKKLLSVGATSLTWGNTRSHIIYIFFIYSSSVLIFHQFLHFPPVSQTEQVHRVKTVSPAASRWKRCVLLHFLGKRMSKVRKKGTTGYLPVPNSRSLDRYRFKWHLLICVRCFRAMTCFADYVNTYRLTWELPKSSAVWLCSWLSYLAVGTVGIFLPSGRCFGMIVEKIHYTGLLRGQIIVCSLVFPWVLLKIIKR